jgi:kynurenine formamidase
MPMPPGVRRSLGQPIEQHPSIAGRGVRLVGIDYLSVGDDEAHVELLRAGVVPLEGLDLRAVEPGEYRLVCLPLQIVGSDGAPARALLLRDCVARR